MSTHEPQRPAVPLGKDEQAPARPQSGEPAAPPVPEAGPEGVPLARGRDFRARPQPEGCLAVVIRWPVRILTLVLVLPVRMVWDALVVCGHALRRVLWRPFARAVAFLWRTLVARPAAWLGRGIAACARGIGVALVWLAKALFFWPWAALWQYVLAPCARGIAVALTWVVRQLLVHPLVLLYRYLLTPFGRGLAWLGHHLLVLPGRWIHRYVLAPLGRGFAVCARAVGAALGWLGRMFFVVPLVALHRYVLAPLGRGFAVVVRETVTALGHAWRIAGHVSRAVFGFLGRVLKVLFVIPSVWLWRSVVGPAGRAVRDGLWRPVARVVRETSRAVRASLRQTRAEIRRALFGGPRNEERKPL